MLEHIICRCPFCSVKLKLGNPQLEGKKIKCPKCTEPFIVVAISDTSLSQDSPTTESKPKPKATVPPRVEKKAVSQPVAADDDWLNDLGDAEDSSGKLPPIVRKKKKTPPEKIHERKRSEQGREIPLVLHYFMMAGTGLIGGLIGAAIWAALIYFTGYEIGYVAVFVGFLSGLGVRFGASQWDYGLGPGLAAVAVAIMALIVGKVAGYHLIIQREFGNIQEIVNAVSHENFQIAAFADEIKAAMPNAPPAGEPNADQLNSDDLDDVHPEALPQQYPKEIWEQARAKWDALSDEEKKQRLNLGEEVLAELAKPNLSIIFGPFDLLWFFLAIGAAYRGATGDHDD
jgi:hypothetical protein